MNKAEFGKVWLILTKSYTWFKADDASQIQVWYQFFENDSFEVLMNAVLAYISTSCKEPSISDLRKAMIVKLDEITADEAWAQVMNAVEGGIGHKLCSEEKYKRYKTQTNRRAFKIGERMGWCSMGIADASGISFTRGQFIKLWEKSKQNDEYRAMIPSNIKRRITSNNKQMLVSVEKP